MRAQAAPKLAQNRLGWVTPDLGISSRGDTLYFVGCLTYFETFFSDFGVQLQEIARATVKLLNWMGVEPVVLQNERCCGHDLFWSGDEVSFKQLRQLNLESFQKAGVKTIVTACAECSHVLKDLYPGETQSYPFEVMHLSEYLQGAGFQPERRLNLTATYQDPCRLGRFQEVYEAPRELMRSILELHEMPHFGAGAWCCGNSSWLNCDRYSKQIQVERLSEAKGTQSDLLLTGCPKCQVHLACAMRDANLQRDLRMKVKDLSVVLAESIA
jgi:Fe-S oxidoreductase